MKEHTLTKLTRPSLTEIFPRNRLFEELDHLREQEVIWVAGPPGSGKSILISDYIETLGLPCLWYQIDTGDVDEAAFFRFMNLAAKEITRQESPLPLFNPEHPAELDIFTHRFFESLYDLLEIPSIIVFDDYQNISVNSSFHELICIGLSKIPEGVTVILISRSHPPPVLIRSCLNRQMEILGWNSLRLTLEETGEIIRYRIREEISEETILELYETTDGWASGLILMALKAKTENIGIHHLGRYIPEEIFDYFRSETFNKTDEETQDFLLRTSLLPAITVNIAEKLTDHPRAERILSQLYHNNCFMEKRFLSEPVYRYHPLFKKFLFSRALETFPKKHLLELCRRAALLLEETDQPEAAFSLLDEAGDNYGKAKLIIVYAPGMLTQGKHQLMGEWLDTLPKDMVEDTPRLLYWKALCYLPFDPGLSRHYFIKAFEGFRQQGNVTETLLAGSGIIEAIAYSFENFTELDPWIQTLDPFINEAGNPFTEKTEIHVTSRMFMALLLRQPDHSGIEKWAERAVLLTEGCSRFKSDNLLILFQLVLYRMFKGEFRMAETALKSLQQLTRTGEGVPPLDQIRAGYAEAAYYQFTGKHEACLQTVSECLELSQISGIRIMDCLLTGQAVASTLNINDCETAGKLMEDMSSRLEPCKKWELSSYHFLKAREALFRKNAVQASFHADISLNLADELGYVFFMGFRHLMKANVLHELGKPRRAEKHLKYASDIAERTKSKLLKFHIHWHRALFKLDRGAEVSGFRSLRKALSIGKEERYLNTFVDQPAVTATLCARALDAGIEVGYVQNIIRKRNLIRYDALMQVHNWPWSLKIFTLGRFSIVKDGEPVPFSGKTQQKPMEMLKVLIALGGREIRDDRIADELWPYADGDIANKSFKTTLHRLRKLLGNHEAIRLRDGRVTLNQKYCWVDVWAFQRTFGQADAAWKRGDVSSMPIDLAQKAIDIYNGPFLPEETWKPWAIPLRERLRSKFLRGVIRLGQHREENKQWKKAVECYQRGLEVDSLAEDFYQRLMICYHQLGLRAEALAVYDRCKKILSATLGIDPSDKTEKIRKTIL